MKPIEKRITINATASKVWKALTDPGELEKWMMMTTDFAPQIGRKFIFRTNDPGENWDGIFQCRVEELIENKKLVYTWNAGFINADTLVSIELKENNGKTEVVLTHSGWEKLASNQEQTKNSHSEGWELRVIQKLKEEVEK